MNKKHSLKPFFNPQGVAVIGASQNPSKLGYRLAQNLSRSGYEGAVHFVNIKGGRLLGQPIHKNLADVPDPVDLAVVLIPAPFVPDIMEKCGKRGIHAAIIGSGGFREAGPEGAKLQEEMLQIADRERIRLIGPNCIGLLDTHLPIDTTFLPPPGPTPGDVAFLSQSGAICAAAIDWARGQGYGISRLISLGNQADVSETDLLEPVAEDEHTHVLALYLEGIKSGRRFVREARGVVQKKPIIALKVGKYEAGRKAVASHTGALAGQESAYNAAFRRSGVLRAKTSEEMFDQARALAWSPLPKGNQVGVLTNAGGPGVTAADALEEFGLEMAAFTEKTLSSLQEILPKAASFENPVDMLASASPDQFASCLKVLLDDPETDSVMVIYPSPPLYTAGAVAKAIIPIIHGSEKPVVVSVMGERLIQEAVEHLRAARIPEYRFPERAAAAIDALCERADLLEFAKAEPLHPPDIDKETVKELIANPGNGNIIDSQTAQRIFAAYGIRTAHTKLARSEEEAVEISQKVGLPVVLKIASSEISHKSDVGGVLLDLGDEGSIRSGYQTILRQAQNALPDAEMDGVYVQKMIPAGQEVIIGAVQDPQFGGLVMFGSGGTEVEGLKDIAFGLAPLTEKDLDYMLENTWAGRKLHGFRNLPPADIKAVREALARLAQLAADFPHIQEIEINPLRVLPEGQGAVAVDIRIKSS
ncbi:MAG: acetate--CoA ligase family protein [Anaerolineales bacterium]|nr:acetate--CoA ligase family protein [Anaerolineales bacterium]MBS3753851.1 acetate--CoA ligase family protein [Anaerolineales bacterium]